ncbi:MAG: hypothetical protein JWN69_2294, partial [Alphaproteobacteria bacterium]|nr:hypothetical protein [Alphaproteobacteria bacterium]
TGRWRGNIGHGDHRGHGDPDRPRRHGGGGHRGSWGNSGYGGYGAVIGYGDFTGYGDDFSSYATTVPAPDQFGFFGNGGEAMLVNGNAVYEYDRSYPYEYYRAAEADQAAAPEAARSTPSGCEVQWVPDGHGGDMVPVRICRR